ncbi:MAG: hypothetical protein ACK50P_01560 [Planctomycetaceae bacterium]|jgi:hypothetical protein
MSRRVNVVALVKNNERYLFLFDDESRESVLKTMSRFAENEELSFTWYDAAVLTQKVQQLESERLLESEPWSSGPRVTR